MGRKKLADRWTTMTVRLPEEEAAPIVEVAKAMGVSPAAIAREHLREAAADFRAKAKKLRENQLRALQEVATKSEESIHQLRLGIAVWVNLAEQNIERRELWNGVFKLMEERDRARGVSKIDSDRAKRRLKKEADQLSPDGRKRALLTYLNHTVALVKKAPGDPDFEETARVVQRLVDDLQEMPDQFFASSRANEPRGDPAHRPGRTKPK